MTQDPSAVAVPDPPASVQKKGLMETIKFKADAAAKAQIDAAKAAESTGVAPGELPSVDPGSAADGYDFFYCLEAGHPTAKDLADLNRLFAVPQAKDPQSGAPFCPDCQRLVSATTPGYDEKGKLTVPPSVAALQARLSAVPV